MKIEFDRIQKMAREGETESLEFKESFPDSASTLAKELAAFANTDGGIILIGVTNDGKVVGIDNADKTMTRVANTAHSICRPSLQPVMGRVRIPDENCREIVWVVVERSSNHPVMVEGRYYIRVGPAAVPIDNPDQVNRLIRRLGGHAGEPLSSEVELIDVGLDPELTQYVESDENGKTWIRGNKWSRKFPAFDFKLQNRGSATAFLHRLIVDILDANVDETPVLEVSHTEVNRDAVRFVVHNYGWGPAMKCEIQVKEPTLNRVSSDAQRRYSGEIDTGCKDTILLPFNTDMQARFQALDPGEPSPRQRLEEIELTWKCLDTRNQMHQGRITPYLGRDPIFLTAEGYCTEKRHEETASFCISPASPADSDVVFVTGINFDPSKGKAHLEYPISRKIPPGDVERFHVLLGSTMSCLLTVRFGVMIDKATLVTSKDFGVQIWNPQNWAIHQGYSDGETLQMAVPFHPLQVGDKAPNFSLPAYPGGTISLSDFRGEKNVVLAFYPRDDTPGCVIEMGGLSANVHKFDAAQSQVLGVSCDTIASHCDFAARYNLKIPLLSDESGTVGNAYGVLRGGRRMPERVLFVIDKSGRIRHIHGGMPEMGDLLSILGL